MAAGGAEEHFAKKLANNNKIVRDRTVKKLRAWISSRPKHGKGFTETDLLKIWKGLFYCMWMSDKPLVQEELTETLSKLIHSFRNVDNAILFIKIFFKTMHREWHGIDRLRLDKFYLLIRAFVNQSFQLLKKHKWDGRLTEKLSEVYREGPLKPNSEAAPVGITLHLAENYFLELQSAGGAEIESVTVLVLLDPLLLLLAHTKNKSVARAVKDGVLEPLVLNKNRSGNEEEEKEQHCQVDYSTLADRLFTLASNREILGRNRNQLYNYIKKFRDITKGAISGEKRKLTPTESVDEESDVTEAPNEDASDQEELSAPTKKKRKKRKSKSTGHQETSEESNERENDTRIEDEGLKVEGNKGKRKSKSTGEDQETIEESNERENDARIEDEGLKVEGKKGKRKSKSTGQDQVTSEESNEWDNDARIVGEGLKVEGKKGKRKSKSTGEDQETIEESNERENDARIEDEGLKVEGKKGKRKSKSTGQDQVTSEESNEWDNDARIVGEGLKVERKGKKGKRKSKSTGEDQETSEETNERENDARIEDEGLKVEGKKGKRRKQQGDGELEERSNLLTSTDLETSEKPESQPKRKKKKKKAVDSVSEKTLDSQSTAAEVNGNTEEEVQESAPEQSKEPKDSSRIDVVDTLSASVSKTKEHLVENGDCMKLPRENNKARKVLKKAAQSNAEPFAKFLKVNTTPAAFVRKAVAKVEARTEPRKKANEKATPTHPTPKSAPTAAARKRVRIELKKNTAHSHQDYQNSVKDSPDIPYSADRTPTHGLLRTPLTNHVTTKGQLEKGRKNSAKKRAKAADFF